MKVLVVYGTNSGSTRFASEHISEVLMSLGHETIIEEAWETNFELFSLYDLVLLGTNNWLYNDNQGQPHVWYLQRSDELKMSQLKNVRGAVFSLGDSSYAKYAASGGVLKEMFEGAGMKVSDNIMRIDAYLANEAKHNMAITEWLGVVLSEFQQ